MNKGVLFFAFFLLAPSCWGQDSYTLPLAKANTALSLPAMTAGGGVLYEAHRSFDLLRFSNELQVSAYDLATHKELKRTVIPVPRVHGARAAEGFYLSPDGQMLVYAELHSPNLLLVLSTNNLTEVRRTDSLPFTPEDRERLFAGFDDSGLLSFASSRTGRLRFLRMNLSDFKTMSEVLGPKELNYQGGYAWSPNDHTVWVPSNFTLWQQFTEEGRSTGEKFSSQSRKSVTTFGAVPFGGSDLLAFFGNLIDSGGLASYKNHHLSELDLACVPRPYSSGEVPDYAGAICTTSPDREPEHGGDKILSSEFLLLNADGPTIAWRHPMDFLSVADSNDPDTGIQRGDPLLYRTGSKLVIVAPSKAPALTVYEIAAPQ